MSEKPQLDSAGDLEADERSLSRRVSRETNSSEETSELTPEQKMLNDIMDRGMERLQEELESEAEPDPPAQEEAAAPQEEQAPPPPAKNKPSSAYVYLAVLFGAAFLMLLLAYFVQQRNSDAVQDDLELLTASREELLENIKVLEEERDRFQKQMEEQKKQVEQLNQENEDWKQYLNDARTMCAKESSKARATTYLWYLDQFMQAKDYAMAAAVLHLNAINYKSPLANNPAQLQQFQKYQQELIDRGYSQEIAGSCFFTQQWDPSQNEDMAAICILWCALDKHFVEEYDLAAAQYLANHPLGDPASGYQERIERLASGFTLEQFQLMKDELVEDKWLVIAEDGTMSEGSGPTGFKNDVLCELPFELPSQRNDSN